mmetsp:Transcript_23349/g.43370  ORF Transcript_23349/g.43370 Transcript_23349/m.43370 type:complete len:372 (+) Transcript_23349:819-1934(+)
MPLEAWLQQVVDGILVFHEHIGILPILLLCYTELKAPVPLLRRFLTDLTSSHPSTGDDRCRKSRIASVQEVRCQLFADNRFIAQSNINDNADIGKAQANLCAAQLCLQISLLRLDDSLEPLLNFRGRFLKLCSLHLPPYCFTDRRPNTITTKKEATCDTCLVTSVAQLLGEVPLAADFVGMTIRHGDLALLARVLDLDFSTDADHLVTSTPFKFVNSQPLAVLRLPPLYVAGNVCHADSPLGIVFKEIHEPGLCANFQVAETARSREQLLLQLWREHRAVCVAARAWSVDALSDNRIRCICHLVIGQHIKRLGVREPAHEMTAAKGALHDAHWPSSLDPRITKADSLCEETLGLTIQGDRPWCRLFQVTGL